MNKVTVCLLLLSYASSARAQAVISRALSYDTLLQWNLRTGRGEGQGVTKRLNYRETLIHNGRKEERVVYVYQRYGTYFLKQFIDIEGPVDSLVTCPEKKLAGGQTRRACRRYFAEAARYKRLPRYEYRPGVDEQRPTEISLPPQWMIRVVYRKSRKKWGVAMFHQMDATANLSEFAKDIEQMNREFAQFHDAIQQYVE